MNASYLIKILGDLIKEKGDLPVFSGCGIYEPQEGLVVSVSTKKMGDIFSPVHGFYIHSDSMAMNSLTNARNGKANKHEGDYTLD